MTVAISNVAINDYHTKYSEIKKVSISHYMKENKVKAIQGTERLEAEEGTEQAEAVWICKLHKFAETYIKKKEEKG